MQEPPLHHKIIGTVIVTTLFCWWLNACATHPDAPKPYPKPTVAAPVAKPSCIALKPYSQDQLKAMAAAERDPAANPVLRGLVIDYAKLRSEVRAACPK